MRNESIMFAVKVGRRQDGWWCQLLIAGESSLSNITRGTLAPSLFRIWTGLILYGIFDPSPVLSQVPDPPDTRFPKPHHQQWQLVGDMLANLIIDPC